jgi:hypothetical protein
MSIPANSASSALSDPVVRFLGMLSPMTIAGTQAFRRPSGHGDAIMRTNWIAAVLVAAAMLTGELVQAADGCGCGAQQACGCGAGDACGGYGDPCDPCGDGGGRGGLFGRRNRGPRYEGLEAGFNCGCNGSYKFPVPPLYTYHWPGMWSAQLMTDYHSPWRFPPLKPYTEEVPPAAMGVSESSRRLMPVSAMAEIRGDTSEQSAFSRHLMQMTR